MLETNYVNSVDSTSQQRSYVTENPPHSRHTILCQYNGNAGCDGKGDDAVLVEEENMTLRPKS